MASILEPYAVRAVGRTLDILELLHAAPRRVTVTMVAALTGLPKTSAFRYLATLELRGYVERAADGTYLPVQGPPSPPPLKIIEQIALRARPLLERLREQFHESVSLGFLDGRRLCCVVAVKNAAGIRIELRSGTREMLHCTAYGKALAARLRTDRVHEILTLEGMPRFTPNTITSLQSYDAELDQIRRRGYAINNAENVPGARCVAMALSTVRYPLAITLSAPIKRLSPSRMTGVLAAFRTFDSDFGSLRGAA